ncbi:MAG: hypothetical protein ACLRSW_07480 [Christensenellaceae bacterium]
MSIQKNKCAPTCELKKEPRAPVAVKNGDRLTDRDIDDESDRSRTRGSY